MEVLALKRVVSFQLQQILEPEHVTKTKLASRMKTSWASLDRMLDPSNPSLNVASLGKAAALGRKVELRFVSAGTGLIPLMNFFAETFRETLDEWDVSQAEVSRMTGIPSPHLTDMKKSRRRCTPEYDLRLSRYLGTSPGFWLRLQLDFELMRAERENGEKISREVTPHAA